MKNLKQTRYLNELKKTFSADTKPTLSVETYKNKTMNIGAQASIALSMKQSDITVPLMGLNLI